MGVRDLKNANRLLFARIRAIFLLRLEVFSLEDLVGELREQAILVPVQHFLKLTSMCWFCNDRFPTVMTWI